MKIAIVFDGLGFGGIERIGIDYSNMALELGYEVDVYNLNPSANGMVNLLSDKINYYPIRFSRKVCPELYSYGIQKWWWGKYAYALISFPLSLVQRTKKLFIKRRKYDVAIAIAGHINDLSFVGKSFVISKKKIVWCHGNLLSYLAICDAYSILYKKIDKIVTLSSAGQKDIYPGRKYMYDKSITKIYNPTYIKSKHINIDFANELKSKYGDFVLMIARAEWQKGYDIALHVFDLLLKSGFDKKIVFLGNGPMMDEYKKMAIELGLENNSYFEGAKTNVCDYIYASYINLLTSRWEGLPTVIVEAMSLGKPCVMTNTDDGEVSGNGKYCILKQIDDIDGIVESIKALYTDKNVYDKYCDLSLKRSFDFSPERIKKQFRELIEG